MLVQDDPGQQTSGRRLTDSMFDRSVEEKLAGKNVSGGVVEFNSSGSVAKAVFLWSPMISDPVLLEGALGGPFSDLETGVPPLSKKPVPSPKFSF